MGFKQVTVAGIVDDIRRIFQVLSEQSRQIEKETGLTGSQLWVVKILEETSPLKVSELARRMYLHPTTMVGLLDRLESKGIVQRMRSEDDRRVVLIELTQSGRNLVGTTPAVVQNMLVKGLEELAEQRLSTISDSLSQIVTILGVQNLPPKLIMSSDVNIPKRRRKLRLE